MPALIRLYIFHLLTGFALSAGFVFALMYFDVAGLWRLISGSDMAVLALVMLWLFHGLVFAGVQFGIRIMREGAEGPGAGTRRPERISGEAVPVVVRQGFELSGG
jgi:hypothetical protein